MMPVRVLLVLVFLGTSSFLSNRLTEPVHPLVASIMAKFERILYTGEKMTDSHFWIFLGI